MSDTIIPSDPSTGDPTKTSLPVAQNAAIGALAGHVDGLQSADIPNGNFEIDDGGAPPEFTQWTVTNFSGGSHSVATTAPLLSGLQYLQMTATSGGGFVEAESEKINGGHFAIDLSFIYRSSAMNPRFRVELLEYEGVTLVSTLTIHDSAAAALISTTPIGITPNGLIGNADGTTGNSNTFTVKFIVGESGGSTDGSIDIDAVSITTRAALISRPEFVAENQNGGAITNGFELGFIFIPAGTTTVSIECVLYASTAPSATKGVRAIINGVNGTIDNIGVGTEPQGDQVTTVVTPATGRGIFSFALEISGGTFQARAKTLFTANAQGVQTGIVYA